VCVLTCGVGIAWQVGLEQMSTNKKTIKDMMVAKAAKEATSSGGGVVPPANSTSVHSELSAHVGDGNREVSITQAAPQATIGSVANTTSISTATQHSDASPPKPAAAAAGPASPADALRSHMVSVVAPPPAIGSPVLMSPPTQDSAETSPSPKENFQNLANLTVMCKCYIIVGVGQQGGLVGDRRSFGGLHEQCPTGN
jgi:hypothetical protein